MRQLGARVNLVICQKSKINDWVEHVKRCYPDYAVYNLTKKDEITLFVQYSLYRHEFSPVIVGVINYELAWRRPELLKLRDFTLMLDESSLIQNRKAKQSKFILKLGNNAANVILLSGTPTAGKYENLWTQIHLLGWDISESAYNSHYVNWKTQKIGWMNPKIIRVVDKINPYKNIERLKEKMREHGAQFLKTEECFDLPEQTFIEVNVDKPKIYDKFMKDSIVEIDGNFMVGDTSLTKRLYARQICGIYNPYKLQAFREILQSTNDRLIVFYNFNDEKTMLLKECELMDKPVSVVCGSEKNLEAYEQFDNSVTLIQYQAGAKGLNLQKANKIIYFTPTPKCDDWMQSLKRVHRIGQQKPCFYYKLICKGTVEEDIYSCLERGVDYTDWLFEDD